ncbi:MAG: SDR family NAD(P)-dependent oxidoreductase [Planctomycetes bacterium]|nr:SDR family NAD(P)-dependent oxidoreductase [Planctomycetota bacterium]
MQSPLQGRRAIVTGASSGIGAATARALAAAGAEVVLCGRDRARLEAVAAECPRGRALLVDVRDAQAVRRALEPVGADLVVNNAGLALGAEQLPAGDPAEWAVVVDTNLKGVLHVLSATLPGMKAAGRGDHVLVGSVAGRQVYPGGNVYCATKHAVRALYEAQRLDLAGSGVRVATVDPGMVATGFSGVRFRGDAARAAAVYAGMTPLSPADVAEAILWIVTRPPHVNVGELVLWPTDQASTTLVHRR